MAPKKACLKAPRRLAPDMVDVLWLAIGVIGGAVATAIALEAMGRARDRTPTHPTVKLTSGWHLRELRTPVIVATDVLDVSVPDGCIIYASGVVAPEVLERCEVHQVPPVRSEFAFDTDRRRALVFTAGLREDTLALLTVEEGTLARLETEWRTLAGRSSEYVERLRIQEMAGKSGVTVETQGLVQDVVPWKERFMLRLEDDGHIIGVVVDKDPEALREEKVLVKGSLRKDQTGYAVIQADEIRRIR